MAAVGKIHRTCKNTPQKKKSNQTRKAYNYNWPWIKSTRELKVIFRLWSASLTIFFFNLARISLIFQDSNHVLN